MNTTKAKHIHFVGIGGIGMSGIAEVLLNLGYKVSGSDVAPSETTKRLQQLGATIFVGHRGEQIQGADIVVYSSAVQPDNPELKAAKSQNIPFIPRGEMLAELMRMKVGIAVAGMHGKTTTTSMVSMVLAQGGLDPTVVIGGKLNAIGTNAKLGQGKYLVAEADESDRSFLLLSPQIAVVTNLDPEHLDHYRDIEDIKSTFVQFLSRLPITGKAILCIDDPKVRDLFPKVQRPITTYGLREDADFRATDITFKGTTSTFTCQNHKKTLGTISLPMPGIHNVTNALAAVAVGLEVGLNFSTIAKGLENFSGVQRRFTIKGEHKGIIVIDDYGHHPTEIQATIKAAKLAFPNRRIVVAFQPHRYTRTRDLFKEFVSAFEGADFIVLTDIYPASEPPILEITTEKLYEAIVAKGQKNILYCGPRDKIPSTLWPELKKNDIVLTMGAGDISKTGDELLAFMRGRGELNG